MTNIEKFKRWLSPKEVEAEYGIAINTQAQYRMRGIIPYSKINSFIRYDRIKLDEWFEKHTVVKNEELA